MRSAPRAQLSKGGEGKRRLRHVLPAGTLTRTQALFLFVVHTRDAMSGATGYNMHAVLSPGRRQTSVVTPLAVSIEYLIKLGSPTKAVV